MQKYFISYFWIDRQYHGFGQNVFEVENGITGVALVDTLIKMLADSKPKGDCVLLNFKKIE